MCGISGIWSRGESSIDVGKIATSMADEIVHRGPDDSGVWVGDSGRLGLSFRRLAILDLSEEGHQPMVSADGRYSIVFNGEIYNYRELQRRLVDLGHQFRGHSDTEVLLAAVVEWGLEETLSLANGMFAVALWDRHQKTLTLVRDRAGKKPLYYSGGHDAFVFGSELKSLLSVPDRSWDISRTALAEFMRLGYIPSPLSIYDGVSKVEPGAMLIVSEEGRKVESRTYWAFPRAVGDFEGTPEDAMETLDALLLDSVEKRMISDVPLGALLSGGIDSSLIVGYMQKISTTPVRTFSIGFEVEEFNEAPYARRVAEHLGTDHTERIVSPAEALALIPSIPTIYDEPLGDVSQIPTYIVAKLARRDVTVVLTGDGGDELFGGYSRYDRARRLWKHLSRIPRAARKFLGDRGRKASVVQLERAAGLIRKIPGGLTSHVSGDRLLKLAEMTGARDSIDFYEAFVAHWKAPLDLVPGAAAHDSAARPLPDEDFLRYMMRSDFGRYMTDDVLVKVDRATMAVSLEARCPLLDFRVVELARSMPTAMMEGPGGGKQPLRELLYRMVPRELVDRPKTGFGVPLAEWLRTELRDWAEELLDPDRISGEGYLDASIIRRKWLEHLSGERNWHYYLWDVLMFEGWLEHQRNGNRQVCEAEPSVAGTSR